MMSITNRSRILVMILVIGMILSLVPVMAAASNDYSVGYAKITYPTGGSKLYTVAQTILMATVQKRQVVFLLKLPTRTVICSMQTCFPQRQPHR